MGHSMMQPHHSGDLACEASGCCGGQGWQSPFFVPVPMAVFGVLIAFMFGRSMGETGHGDWSAGMGRGKPWMKGGMRHHHHHGAGTTACCCGQAPSETTRETAET